MYGHDDDAFACTVFGSGEENSVIHVRRSDIHIAAPNKKGLLYTFLILINKKKIISIRQSFIKTRDPGFWYTNV